MGDREILGDKALLCLGMTASALEFWLVPAPEVGRPMTEGTVVNRHGGAKVKGNTYWLTANEAIRERLSPFAAQPEDLRELAMRLVARQDVASRGGKARQ